MDTAPLQAAPGLPAPWKMVLWSRAISLPTGPSPLSRAIAIWHILPSATTLSLSSHLRSSLMLECAYVVLMLRTGNFTTKWNLWAVQSPKVSQQESQPSSALTTSSAATSTSEQALTRCAMCTATPASVRRLALEPSQPSLTTSMSLRHRRSR